MGDLLPGVALRFTPGYHISPLRGLRTNARHSQRCLESMDIKSQRWNSAYAKLTKAVRAPSTGSGTGVPSVRSVSLSNWPLSSGKDKNIFKFLLGAKSKGSNGVVAVGLPHRNSSVLKQAHINQWEVKGRIRKRSGASTSGLTSAAQ